MVSVRQAQAAGQGGKVGPPAHDDLVRRDFTADGPNRLWLADITEHHTAEGKLYLCAIKDVWSNRTCSPWGTGATPASSGRTHE